MPTHLNLRYREVEDAMTSAEKLESLGKQYGITDVYADNGVKVLQLAVATGLDIVPGRIGADAQDRIGNEYEIKTADLNKKVTGFSTNHHLNKATISKFRQRRFVFAMYRDSKLYEAYLVEPDDLNVIFRKWELALHGKTHLNNPKIPLDYVRKNGEVMYLKDVAPAWIKGKEPTTYAAA